MTRARVAATSMVASVALWAWCPHAFAAPPSDPAVSLSFVAAPIFGAEAATGLGWNEVVARVDNGGSTAARGVLELSMAQGWSSSEPDVAARAPFAVPAGRSAIVAIPMHGFAYSPRTMVTAKTESGATIQTVNVSINGLTAPLLVEVEEAARLSYALRGWPLDAKWIVASSGAANNALSVGTPGFDHATGDPILPEHASSYAATTVVLIRSNRLVALDEAKRDALVGWVNGGGTLAIVPSRPEDLRAPFMASLLGGDATAVDPPARLMLLPAHAKPTTSTLGAGLTPPAKTKPKSAHGGGAGEANDDDTPVVRIGPSFEMRDHLSGYAGGNLRDSDFGATAPCGLGEVHLLPFDPMTPEAAVDPWVETRMIALVERAWDRHAQIAFPIGGGDRSMGRLEQVRRALDPNENFRAGLGVSALILLVYSILVGPVVFARAAKRGTPLSPLLWVPAWSAAAFVSIVAVGLAEKGWRGRARRLTVLEAGSASPHATMRSYRGFFASETKSLSIAPLERASVLEVAPTEGFTSHTDYGTLRIDRDGLTLGELTSLPWQTVVVREDGLVDLGKGIALVPTAGGGLDVVNESGRALKDVIVHSAHDAAYFATIDDGQRVTLSSGRPVFSPGGASTTMAGSMRVHALGASWLATTLGPEGKRIGDAWTPLESAAGDSIDWWPDDTPVLLGEVASPSHASSDSGLALESERVFVRVVGARQEKP